MSRQSSRDKQRLVENLIRAVARGRFRPGRYLLLAGLVVLLAGYIVARPVLQRQFGVDLPDILTNDRQTDSGARAPADASIASVEEAKILDAFQNRRSDVMVRAKATVKKLLRDDDVGDRHQKMILRLPSGHTLLLAHNVDLADRVPAREGDEIEFCGEYEYSEQGGVIHWTHHDPGGRHADGWIRHRELKYQ